MANKPGQVLDALRLSNATMATIRQNLCWAFGYNLVGVPIAAGALLPQFGVALTPSISGALMGISSLAVMGNSLLLRREASRPAEIADDGGESAGGAVGSATVAVAGAGAKSA